MKFRMLLLGPDDPDRRPSREVEPRDHYKKTTSYEQQGGGMVRIEGRKDGAARHIPLTNFNARIVREIVSDDGVEQHLTLGLQADVAGKTICFVLQPPEFNRMNWVLRELGPKAIIYPGQQQHARTAIQSLSGEIRQDRVFGHLGWTRDNRSWIYLQPGQVIGAAPVVPDLKVCLADPLKHYYAPQPTDRDALVTAIRSSLRLLTVAQDRIMIPLLSAAYRAPLGTVDFALFLAGRTGTFKTAIAALCQQHFGAAMNAAHLPANFASTGCALEEIAFQAKDSLVVIDDFVPTGRGTDGALQGLAERIFRAAGNRQGRSRMTGHGLRASRPPRALLLATGEEVPHGHSIRARLFVIEARPGDVNQWALTKSQADADKGLFASAMGGYMAWIAAQFEQIQDDRAARIRALRARGRVEPVHARLPEMTADLEFGWQVFLQFANESGAISDNQRAKLEHRGHRVLHEAASRQACFHKESDPALDFLSLLRAALSSGLAHLADRAGNPPQFPERWGWRRYSQGFEPQGDRVGWVADDDVFLEPARSYTVVQSIRESSGTPISPQALRHRLHEAGLLVSVDAGRGMLLVRRILEGSSRQVLHLKAADLGGGVGPGA